MFLFSRFALLFGFAAAASAGVRESAEQALALIEKTAIDRKGPCASFHHQSLAMLALDSARRHGLAINEPAAREHFTRTVGPFLSSADAVSDAPLDVFAVGYGLLAADASGVWPNMATSALARKFADAQLPDGHWTGGDGQPPLSSSDFTATALAVRVLSLFTPELFAPERDLRLERARKWLLAAEPRSTEDRASQLLGLLWSGAPSSDRKRVAKALIEGQRADGGWAQEPGMESDAYATGRALHALRQADALSKSSTRFRFGVGYLLDMQQPDGSWQVKDNSFSGSAWAVLAILEMLPSWSR
jgi:hypothetical protein